MGGFVEMFVGNGSSFWSRNGGEIVDKFGVSGAHRRRSGEYRGQPFISGVLLESLVLVEDVVRIVCGRLLYRCSRPCKMSCKCPPANAPV